MFFKVVLMALTLGDALLSTMGPSVERRPELSGEERAERPPPHAVCGICCDDLFGPGEGVRCPEPECSFRAHGKCWFTYMQHDMSDGKLVLCPEPSCQKSFASEYNCALKQEILRQRETDLAKDRERQKQEFLRELKAAEKNAEADKARFLVADAKHRLRNPPTCCFRCANSDCWGVVPRSGDENVPDDVLHAMQAVLQDEGRPHSLEEREGPPLEEREKQGAPGTCVLCNLPHCLACRSGHRGHTGWNCEDFNNLLQVESQKWREHWKREYNIKHHACPDPDLLKLIDYVHWEEEKQKSTRDSDTGYWSGWCRCPNS